MQKSSPAEFLARGGPASIEGHLDAPGVAHIELNNLGV